MGVYKGYKQTKEHKENRAVSKRRGSYFNCLKCGKQFWRKPYEIKRGNNKFCSKECYLTWQKGMPRSKNFIKKCKAKKGLLNANWKGGITPENKKIRDSVTIPSPFTSFKSFNALIWSCTDFLTAIV